MDLAREMLPTEALQAFVQHGSAKPQLPERAKRSFLSALQLTLGVEIGTLELSAAELLDLLPGAVFEFEFDPLSCFCLRVGEEEVATAKFVSSNGVLGLEIVSLKSHSAETIVDKNQKTSKPNSQMHDNEHSRIVCRAPQTA